MPSSGSRRVRVFAKVSSRRVRAPSPARFGVGSRFGHGRFASSSGSRRVRVRVEFGFASSSRPQPSPVRGRFAFQAWLVRDPVRVRAEFGFAPRRVRAEFAPPAQPGSAWPSLVQPSPAQPSPAQPSPSPSPSPSPAGFAMCRVRVRVEFAAWGRAGSGSRFGFAKCRVRVRVRDSRVRGVPSSGSRRVRGRAGSGSRFGFAKCRVRVRFGFAICRVRVRESSGSRQGEFASSSRFAGTRFASRFDQPSPAPAPPLSHRASARDGSGLSALTLAGLPHIRPPTRPNTSSVFPNPNSSSP